MIISAGASGLEPEPFVLETKMLPLTPCPSYYEITIVVFSR